VKYQLRIHHKTKKKGDNVRYDNKSPEPAHRNSRVCNTHHLASNTSIQPFVLAMGLNRRGMGKRERGNTSPRDGS
jgi:hypothetical protein